MTQPDDERGAEGQQGTYTRRSVMESAVVGALASESDHAGSEIELGWVSLTERRAGSFQVGRTPTMGGGKYGFGVYGFEPPRGPPSRPGGGSGDEGPPEAPPSTPGPPGDRRPDRPGEVPAPPDREATESADPTAASTATPGGPRVLPASTTTNASETATDGASPDESPPGCFIATAAYGTPTAAEIDVLRAFRDRVLLRYTWGRLIVEFYYRHSPPAAAWIARSDRRRQLVRRLVVAPLVVVVEAGFTASQWLDRVGL